MCPLIATDVEDATFALVFTEEAFFSRCSLLLLYQIIIKGWINIRRGNKLWNFISFGTTYYTFIAFLEMYLISIIVAGFIALASLDALAASKILLLYPVPYPSHWRAFRPLIDELAKRGHQITAYTTIPGLESFKNFEHIRINSNTTKSNIKGFDVVGSRSMSSITYTHYIWKFFSSIHEAALESRELQALMLSNEQFDLMIAEATFMTESILGFSHKFKVPVVNMHPLFLSPWMAQLVGVPQGFSYIPHTLEPLSEEMNFWQRTRNLIIGMYEILAGNWFYLPYQERMMRRHFKYPGSKNIPPLSELIANISLHLVDSHQLMTSVRPYAPNVIDVAGMNIRTARKLPQDLQNFLDEASEGFIYVSFGSYFDADVLPKQFKRVLIGALKEANWRVVMRWSGTIEDASHILTRPWLPQQDILAHPNCKLFITHGGFNSLMEAMSIGVPTLGMPFFSDQRRNVLWYEQHGVGLEISYEDASVSDIVEKINEIIRNPSFMENAKRIAKLYRDEPRSTLANAVYWVEYVIRHKGAHHLKPFSVKLPYYQYLLLDVVAFLISILFVTIFILYYVIRATASALYLPSAEFVSPIKKRK